MEQYNYSLAPASPRPHLRWVPTLSAQRKRGAGKGDNGDIKLGYGVEPHGSEAETVSTFDKPDVWMFATQRLLNERSDTLA